MALWWRWPSQTVEARARRAQSADQPRGDRRSRSALHASGGETLGEETLGGTVSDMARCNISALRVGAATGRLV